MKHTGSRTQQKLNAFSNARLKKNLNLFIPVDRPC